MSTTSIVPLRSRILGASTALLTVAGLGLASAPIAQAAALGTTTASLSVRAGTNTGTAVLTTIPAGVSVSVACQAKGEAIDGTYNSDWWGRVTYNGRTGYVSRAYLTIPDATGLGECSAAPDPGPIVGDRQRVIDRGMYWVNKGVPYSMYAYAAGPDADGYRFRTDCSGMVSMAFNLRDKSYSTVNLPEKFYPIAKSSLAKGDIVGNLGPGSAGASGHVVIFNGWADSAHTRFYTVEENGSYGATTRIVTWGSSFWNNQGYRLRGW